MPRLKNIFIFTLLLIFACLILLLACEKENKGESKIESAEAMQTEGDSSKVQETTISGPNAEKLQAQRAELENRLEVLLSKIEEIEDSLLQREKRLIEQAKSLDEREKSLNEWETRLRRQQAISWIVLVLGVLGIFLGIVIALRRKKSKKESVETKDKKVAEAEPSGKDVASSVESVTSEEVQAKEVKSKPGQSKETDSKKETKSKSAPKPKSKSTSKSKPKNEPEQ